MAKINVPTELTERIFPLKCTRRILPSAGVSESEGQERVLGRGPTWWEFEHCPVCECPLPTVYIDTCENTSASGDSVTRPSGGNERKA